MWVAAVTLHRKGQVQRQLMAFKLPSRFGDPWELELPSRKWGFFTRDLVFL